MNILIFGNSVTQGFNDTEHGGWANRLHVYAIKKRVDSNYEYNKSVFSLGISGGNTTTLLRRVETELKARIDSNEDVVLFAIGVNDSQYDMRTGENRVSIEVYEKNLREIIKKIQTYTPRIVFIEIPPIDEQRLMPVPWKTTHGYNDENIQKYNNIQEKICTQENLPLILMNDVFDDTSLDIVLTDGIHPSAEGHKLMFERIKDKLEKLAIL